MTRTITINNEAYNFTMKHFPQPSIYGIDGGRISKLDIRHNGETVCHYERGWDMKPSDANAEKALTEIILKYN